MCKIALKSNTHFVEYPFGLLQFNGISSLEGNWTKLTISKAPHFIKIPKTHIIYYR